MLIVCYLLATNYYTTYYLPWCCLLILTSLEPIAIYLDTNLKVDYVKGHVVRIMTIAFYYRPILHYYLLHY